MKQVYLDPFPPQNYLAEEILLGTIIINPIIFPQVIPIIKEESFFLECNQLIYKNLIAINKKNRLDPISLLYSLSDSKALGLVGGISKVMELMKQSQIFMSSTQFNTYAKELIDLMNNHYIKRLMIQYGYHIIQLAYVKQFPSYKLYNRASSYLDITVKKIPKENIDNFKDLIGNLLFELIHKKPQKHKNSLKTTKFMLSGFQSLDDLTQGLPNGDLIVLAGRPSTGKTSLVINIAYNILRNLNIGICIFSLEMSKMQILYKLIAIASRIPTQDISFNTIDTTQWIHIRKLCHKLIKSKIYINDSSNMSIDYIEYTSRLLYKETSHIELIIIDYLQLIQVETFHNDNRSQELSYITRKLKLLAQNFNIPIIILSQLNRSIETRVNKTPILSDLRESGCINSSIFLDCHTNNQMHAKNLAYNTSYIKFTIQTKNLQEIISNKTQKLHIDMQFLLQYIFICKFHSLPNTQITYNHKLYMQKQWLRYHYITEEENILNHIPIQTYCSILENHYIQNIQFHLFSTVYDIIESNYSHFLSNTLILHNSIEQDADIVMMLYQEDRNLYNISESKILNIFLCKNRNGPTGYCKLVFSPENTSFNNLK